MFNTNPYYFSTFARLTGSAQRYFLACLPGANLPAKGLYNFVAAKVLNSLFCSQTNVNSLLLCRELLFSGLNLILSLFKLFFQFTSNFILLKQNNGLKQVFFKHADEDSISETIH
jgi:hypothetical protein